MSNKEEGSSSLAVVSHDITIIAEESEPILSESVEKLLQIANSRNVEERFSPIYTVPSRLRDVSLSSFTPRVVSIGPIHRGRANLKLMQDKKATYLDELLTEVCSPERGSRADILTRCEKKVSDSIKEIKRYYFGKYFMKDGYSDDKLVQIMVMDACFILQFINKLFKAGDELYENRLRSRSVGVDLVLLENQIPFFVLKDIYEVTFETLKPPPHSLTEMLHELLERVNPFAEKLNIDTVGNLSDERTPPLYHILGILHEFYKPERTERPIITAIPAAYSAVELHKVGVRFRPNKDKKFLMAVKFQHSLHKPTLKMPRVLIDNFFEVIMRNLIAYEQYSTPVKNYATSYAMAMDMIVATPGDVAKLVKSNVLVNNLGSNEKASYMINNICKDVTFPDFYYIESWERTKKYYNSWYKIPWVFTRKYCSTPWKAIALLAAVIVFSIAIIQFIFRLTRFKSFH
ncbi:hypothetical protein SSX86_032508 [Deinandra increscens subsp. villosa]|uniref:Uncharacterized protein n=1 Tax=Deinandra increscens subsp. villosa TaxID=3103831 RepID=A0AAP0C6Z3_9ASTR